MNDSGLSGSRVLITGAGGAVGGATAERMCREGARVLATDVDEAHLREMVRRVQAAVPDADIDALAADLTSVDELAGLFAAVDDGLQGLDCLVCCIGVGSAPLMETTDDEWRRVIGVNLVSQVACTQRSILRFRESSKGGTLILVGSISVHIMATGESAYNAAKGGLASFAETLRKELMPESIKVTLIEPGAINSSMQPYSEGDRATFVEQWRMLDPGQVAEAIMFAATRPAGVDVVTLRIEPMVQKIW